MNGPQASYIYEGMLTWPIQDDQMNMTQICEHDWKIHNNEH